MSLSRINVLKYFLLFALSGILIYLVLNKSISGDETATFAIASMQYSDIFFQKYIGEFNPFGYFILNKFFIDIFEPSQTLLKIIPALFYLLSIIFFYKSLRLIGKNQKFSLVAVVLFSFLPINFYFAIFAKPYSFLLFYTNLIIYLSINISISGRLIYKVIYIIASITALYTHFFSGLILFLLFLGQSTFLYHKNLRYLKEIFILNVLISMTLIPELPIIFDMVSQLANVDQNHTANGHGYNFLFVMYGLMFGNTLAPINYFIILYVLLSFIYILFIFFSKALYLDKELSVILIATVLLNTILSFTGFARPMYLIFLTPFLVYAITKIAFTYNSKFLLFMLFPLMLASNFNFITNNTKFFVSPMYSIDNQYYYGDFISKNLKNNKSLLIISPSYNKSVFKLYSAKFRDNAELAYVDSFGQLSPYNFNDEQIHNEIYLFIENHSQDIELSLDKLYKKKEIIIDKKHTSFTTNKEYSFFKIIKYSK